MSIRTSFFPRIGLDNQISVDPSFFLKNVKQINTLDDLVAAGTLNGNKLTLPSGAYWIGDVIAIPYELTGEFGAVIKFQGLEATLSGFIYLGVSNFFDFEESDIIVDSLLLSAPLGGNFINKAPDVQNITGTFVYNSLFLDINLGNIENISSVIFIYNAFFDCGNGLNFENIATVVMVQNQTINWKNNATSMFSFDGAFSTLSFSILTTKTNSNEYIFDIKSSAVIQNGLFTDVFHLRDSLGEVFAPNSQNQKSQNLVFSGNSGIPNSQVTANISLDNNLLETQIVTQSLPVKINATSWVNDTDIIERFSFLSNGRLTYTGVDEVRVRVSAKAMVEVPAAGNDREVAFFIAKNGTVINESKGLTNVKSGGAQVDSEKGVNLTTNDFIELFVSNEGGNENILVKTALNIID